MRQKSERAQASRPKRQSKPGDTEWIAGRNSVVEALRALMPVTAVYVAEGAERDGRLREAFKLVAEKGVSLLEVNKRELDRLRAEENRLERQSTLLDRERRRDATDPASERLYQAYRHQLGKTRSELESRRHQAYVDRVRRGLSR